MVASVTFFIQQILSYKCLSENALTMGGPGTEHLASKRNLEILLAEWEALQINIPRLQDSTHQPPFHLTMVHTICRDDVIIVKTSVTCGQLQATF